jgi:Uma2 family endonuclease
MSANLNPRLTPEQYLAIEREALVKSEYFNGQMFTPAGASKNHVLVNGNFFAEIRQQLKNKPCEVYSNDMRTYIPRTGLFTYPDIVVVCGEPQFIDKNLDTLLNPILIIEILSQTTEKYERNEKFEHYRSIPSLDEYVLVFQEKPRVESHLRQADESWLTRFFAGMNAEVLLTSIDCKISMIEIYDKVNFEEPKEE